MKKILIIIMLLGCVHASYSSKLSKFLDKMDDKQKHQDAQEWQQDMNFADLSFRLQKRYIDGNGQRCRDYEVRGRSNPFKHGYYTMCDGR